MAKKDKEKKKKKDDKGGDDPVAVLRAAVESTLRASAEGASATRERTREIVDEIAAAAGRVRHTLEDMRVLDEVKRLRSEVESLASRVASLEVKDSGTGEGEAKTPAAVTPVVKQPAAARKRKPVAVKPSPTATVAAKKVAASKPGAGKKPAAAAKPEAAKKPAARKPRAAAKNPAAPKPAVTKPAAASAKPTAETVKPTPKPAA